MVQLGIESTAWGDQPDSRTRWERRSRRRDQGVHEEERSTDEAYSTVVNGALGDIRELCFFFVFRSFFFSPPRSTLFCSFIRFLESLDNSLTVPCAQID